MTDFPAPTPLMTQELTEVTEHARSEILASGSLRLAQLHAHGDKASDFYAIDMPPPGEVRALLFLKIGMEAADAGHLGALQVVSLVSEGWHLKLKRGEKLPEGSWENVPGRTEALDVQAWDVEAGRGFGLSYPLIRDSAGTLVGLGSPHQVIPSALSLLATFVVGHELVAGAGGKTA